MKTKNIAKVISTEILLARFSYDPLSGLIRTKIKTGVRNPGDVLTKVSAGGYAILRINNAHFKAHRVAWQMHYGSPPDGYIDHINGNRLDNRIANLRVATSRQNCANQARRRGRYLRGAYPIRGGKWQAQIRGTYLGCFETEQLAHAAYLAEARNRYGEFARAD